MFRHMGRKIRRLAIFICWVKIIFFVILGVSIIHSDSLVLHELGISIEDLLASSRDINVICGLAVMILGSVLSWIDSWLMCGFGELIENTSIIARK